MYRLLILCSLLAVITSSAQDRGAAVTNTQPAPTGKVYALIVGVSKYSEVVPLKYANRDAEAFAEFLKSKAGGAVDPANIKLYKDEEATRANIFDELYYLKSIVQPGDLLYFYFAGHGDIEQDLSEGEDALLLLHKSLTKNYLSGNEYIPLDKLRSYIGNFSKKGVNVVFIADACHSGAMLIGGTQGRERTLHALAESWGNEVKFLSCQPSEVSEENSKWGGGRGIFSYALEEGLKGLADKNGDSIVTVGEIKRYLESEVARQTDDAQNPDVRGDPKKELAKVDMQVYYALREQKQKALPEMVAMNNARSAEDNLLASASPQVKEDYGKFKSALDNGHLLSPDGISAMAFFSKINSSDASAELKRIMKRNFVSALQDGAMLFIQNQLGGKKDVDDYNQEVVQQQMNKWQAGIDNLNAAINILGDDHYLTPAYKARKLYLEAYVLYFKMTTYTREYTTENLNACIAKLASAVMLEENASYAYYLLGEVYTYRGRENLAEENYLKYLRLNPNDGYAYVNLATLALRDNKKALADSLIEVGVKVGSNHMDEFMDYVAGFYYNWEDFEKAKKYYTKALEYNKKLMSAYLNLGVIAKAGKDYKAAEYNYKKVLEIDSTYAWAYNNLANVYVLTKRKDDALRNYAKAIQYDSGYHVAVNNLAIQYENMEDYDQAFKLYHKAKSIEPYYTNSYFGIGNIHYNKANYDSAIMYYYYCTLLDTNYAKAYYWLGKAYEQNGDKESAALHFYKAATHDTTYGEPWNALGNMAYNKQEYTEAAIFYLAAVGCDTTDKIFWTNLGKAYQYSDSTDLAMKIFRKVINHKDATYSTPYIQIGNIFYDREQYDSAKAYYLKALKYDSLETTAYYNLGLVNDMQKKFDQSISCYRKAIRLDSTYAKAYSSLGDVFINTDKPDSAIKYYQLYLKLDTSFNYDILYSIAYNYFIRPDSANAFKYFNKILEHQNDALSIYIIGTLHQNGGNNTEARKWYKQIEDDVAYRGYVLTQYATIEEVDSNYNKAFDYYQQALQHDSTNVYVWNRIGYLLGYYLKKPMEGRPYIEHAMTMDSVNKNQSFTYMASNYFLAGDTATSLQWYFKAMEKNKEDIMAPYNVGCIYSLQGNIPQALKYLEQSLKMGYNDFEHMSKDHDLDNIRTTKEYKDLIARYQAKNNQKK